MSICQQRWGRKEPFCKGLITLNADFGESYSVWRLGDDEALIQHLDLVNIACGGHASDPETMRSSLKLAQAHSVHCGAHPGYADREGFGRRRIPMSEAEMSSMVAAQIGALQAIARLEQIELYHVKPHGALNNLACADLNCARIVCQAIAGCAPGLKLLAPAASLLAQQGKEQGLCVLEEIFADRQYADDGQLLARSHPQALLLEPEACREHIKAMIEAQAIISINGKRISANIDSVCVHGDTPGATERAQACRDYLR